MLRKSFVYMCQVRKGTTFRLVLINIGKIGEEIILTFNRYISTHEVQY